MSLAERVKVVIIGVVGDPVTRELSRPPSLVLAALGEESQLYGAIAGAMASFDPQGRLVAHPRTA